MALQVREQAVCLGRCRYNLGTWEARGVEDNFRVGHGGFFQPNARGERDTGHVRDEVPASLRASGDGVWEAGPGA